MGNITPTWGSGVANVSRKMLMMRNTIRKKSRLPTAYQEVEWIQSSGKCKMITAVNARTGAELEAKLSVVGSVSAVSVFCGARKTSTSTPRIYLFQYNYGLGIGADNGNINSGTPFIMHEKYIIKSGILSNHQYLEVNGQQIINSSQQSNYDVGHNFALFDTNDNNAGSWPFTNLRVWYAKLKLDGILVSELIPCYRKSDGVVGMYDLCENICPLTGTPFFINSTNSGEFIKGNDV